MERTTFLKGMLGADLIGFHNYDYERHFLSSVKRILKKDVSFNRVSLGNREVVVNTFPMGIDYNKFKNAALTHKDMKQAEKSDLKKQLELHKKGAEKGKLILSIDRLDYTKGVINRIKAFELFLTKYPEYLEKVRLVMLTVPSQFQRIRISTAKKGNRRDCWKGKWKIRYSQLDAHMVLLSSYGF